jgi:arylsulfatase A-like enzyme
MEELLQDTGRFQTAFSDAEKRNIKALYEGEVRYTDQMFVKSVLETLKQNGLYSNTLVIVTSDHGEEFFDHESWLHDHSLYNEGIRIPLIIKFPQARYSGKRLDALTRITDIVPTALEFAGIPRAGLEIDGISLIPIVQKNERSERSVFSHLALRSSQDPPSVVSLIRGDLKIIVHRVIESPYIESRSYKISDYQVELYDLAADPQETKNLAKESAYRATCMQMVREIHDLIQETEARRTQKETVVMDSTLEERLKALGYIK